MPVFSVLLDVVRLAGIQLWAALHLLHYAFQTGHSARQATSEVDLRLIISNFLFLIFSILRSCHKRSPLRPERNSNQSHCWRPGCQFRPGNAKLSLSLGSILSERSYFKLRNPLASSRGKRSFRSVGVGAVARSSVKSMW